MVSLLGKVVLVTGGSTGIGAAVATMMAKAGATLAITYSKSKPEANRTAYRIARNGSECLIIRADAARAGDVQRTVTTLIEHFGRIDVLVNNAGIWKRGEIGKMTEQQWDETLNVNLKGTFLFSNAVVPLMKKQRWGRIINIASTRGPTRRTILFPLRGFQGRRDCIYESDRSRACTARNSRELCFARLGQDRHDRHRPQEPSPCQ